MKIGTLLCALLFVSKAFAADTTAVISPDGKTRFKLFINDHQLYYAVTSRDVPVIDASPMILSIDNRVLTDNVKAGAVKQYTVNERYPWSGVHAVAVNNCRGATIALRQAATDYMLDVRVFNDGIAFRTVVPGAAGAARVPDESTIFNIPAGSEIWYHDLNMHYESVHTRKTINALQAGEWVAPPATFKLPQGMYAAITEADLVNYSGMALEANGKQGLVLRLAHRQPVSYPYKLRYSEEDVKRSLTPAAISGTITTPWRVVMIGEDLNAMVNNDMVHNLCPPPDPKLFPQGIQTHWIRPGRAVWKYLDGGGEGTPEVMKQFSAKAAELGFEHNILEGFWRQWSDEQIRDVVNDGKSHQVGIWLWKHSKELRDKAVRQAFFKRCHDLGITGVKIDFFDSEAKEVIDLYTAILQETAMDHLLVDFHGANKPTGLSRTWPNELTREAVKGMEASKLTDRAVHETTIPFTRFLAGPAEYTVVHFGEKRKNTTWAHQIASAAILSAPLLTYAALPQHLLDNPANGVIRMIPATWDETIVLPPSEIGRLAVYARRKGNTWFLAVMNGAQAQKISIPLSFLQGGNYKATIVKDSPDSAAAVKMEEASYTQKDVISLELAPGGGYLAMLVTSSPGKSVYNVREFGAKGDGYTLDGAAINNAITAAAVTGGTVYFPVGNYLTYTIRLKSNVALFIDHGATILAAKEVNGVGYDAPEPNPHDAYQDFGHSHWQNSLIYGEGLHDIAILGTGMIWGKGLTRSTNQPPGGGNKTIALKQCYNVTINDVSILHGGHFALLATGVDNLNIRGLKVDTDRDGFDIDCCKNVRISDCTVNSPFDDGICLKSSFALGYAKATENVTITNCQVSGYDEGTLLDGTFKRAYKKYSDNTTTGRIKMGTESNGGFKNVTISNCIFDYSRGLALETVDGGLLEDVTITNITMRDIVNAPIFIRLGARMRGPDTLAVGACRRIILSNIVVYNADARYNSIISGIPGHDIEDLQMSNISIYYKGGGTPEMASREVPEFEKDYPEPYRFGLMPAYGFFFRHVKGLSVHDVKVSFMKDELRPAFILDHVADVSMYRIDAQKMPAAAFISLRDVQQFNIYRSKGIKDTTLDSPEKMVL